MQAAFERLRGGPPEVRREHTFQEFLDRINPEGVTGVSLTYLAMRGMGFSSAWLSRENRNIVVRCEVENSTGKKIHHKEKIAKWTEYDESVFDEALPPDYGYRTVLTVNQRFEAIKKRFPETPVQIYAWTSEGEPKSLVEFKNDVKKAHAKKLLPL